MSKPATFGVSPWRTGWILAPKSLNWPATAGVAQRGMAGSLKRAARLFSSRTHEWPSLVNCMAILQMDGEVPEFAGVSRERDGVYHTGGRLGAATTRWSRRSLWR